MILNTLMTHDLPRELPDSEKDLTVFLVGGGGAGGREFVTEDTGTGLIIPSVKKNTKNFSLKKTIQLNKLAIRAMTDGREVES